VICENRIRLSCNQSDFCVDGQGKFTLNQSQIDRQLQLRNPPDEKLAGTQCWSDLLFVHWRLEPQRIQDTLPDGLYVDTFNGDAYLGLVPFSMTQVKVGRFPIVPWVCAFPETNVRTYVVDRNGNPGVLFYSLDAARMIPVMAARMGWHLNYRWARMSVQKSNGEIRYSGKRFAQPFAEYEITVPDPMIGVAGNAGEQNPLPTQSLLPADAGTLEFFLVERYLMFVKKRAGQIAAGRVWHTPYPLANTRVTHCHQTLTDANGFPLNRPPDHVAYSPGVQTKIYSLRTQVF
jgi:uncharacterized protein